MLQLLCIHIGIGQLIPNGLTHHLRYHVLTHFLPEELDLREKKWLSLKLIFIVPFSYRLLVLLDGVVAIGQFTIDGTVE